MLASQSQDSTPAYSAEDIREAAHRYARRLYRAARGMGFSADQADDLVQDVFVTFVASIDRFEGRSSIHTWLFGILLRKAQERRRSRVKDELHDSIDEEWDRNFDAAGKWIRPPLNPDRALENRELAVAIQECLPDLTDQQRDVFTLRMVEELPAADVSKVLDLTVTHVGVLLHRARLRMRTCLGMKGWKVGAP